jgi:hypothetical protein
VPPRFAYWTILIDNKPTAFRARDREELLPTLHQLRRKNADVVMRWFARGRLWESPEAERAAQRAPKAPLEKRDRNWRPGGAHADPRARFTKKSGTARPTRPSGDKSRVETRPQGFAPTGSQGRKPWRNRPPHPRARYDERPSERREEKPPPKPPEPSAPEPRRPAPEQIGTKPKPPERGAPPRFDE